MHSVLTFNVIFVFILLNKFIFNNTFVFAGHLDCYKEVFLLTSTGEAMEKKLVFYN